MAGAVVLLGIVLLVGCTPAAPLENSGLSPEALDFGTTEVGGLVTQAFSLVNTGTERLHVQTLTMAGLNSEDFFLAENFVPVLVAPGEAFSGQMSFAPSAVGRREATLELSLDASSAASPARIALTGTAVTVALCPTPTSFDFGDVQVGSVPAEREVAIHNCGPSTTPVSLAPIQGPNESQFRTLSAAQGTVQPGDWLSAIIAFVPNGQGLAQAELPVVPCTGCPAVLVPCRGTGVDGTLTLTPNQVSFGPLDAGEVESRVVTATNDGSGALDLIEMGFTRGTSFSFSPALPLPATLAPQQSVVVTLQFVAWDGGSVDDELQAAWSVRDPFVPTRTARCIVQGLVRP